MRNLSWLAVFFLLGCPSKPPTPKEIEMSELETKIHKTEAELASYKDKVTNADADVGLRANVAEDEELTRSRLERLKERMKILDPSKAEKKDGGGGGHH